MKELFNKIPITRRSFIKSSLVLAAAELSACENKTKSVAEEVPFGVEMAPTLVYRDHQSSEIIDYAYLNSLFNELQKEKGTAVERMNAVKDNLCLLEVILDEGSAMGVALKIDESGLYLTCDHLVLDELSGANIPFVSPGSIFNLKEGEANFINSFIADPLLNVAIVYAPSGKPQKPIRNIQLLNEPFKSGDKLTQLVLATDLSKPDLDVMGFALTGEVDKPPEYNSSGAKDLIRVKGMIPFGGSSGSPVVNKEGKVVAVESGAYGGSPPINERKYYKGSTIAPIKNVLSLPDQGIRYTYFENGRKLLQPIKVGK